MHPTYHQSRKDPTRFEQLTVVTMITRCRLNKNLANDKTMGSKKNKTQAMAVVEDQYETNVKNMAMTNIGLRTRICFEYFCTLAIGFVIKEKNFYTN